jgi:adenylate kinase
LTADKPKPLAPAIILFGSPGSGKGTQAKLLRRCITGPHISTGDMLRTHIGTGDEIGERAEALIRAGKLVPDELVNQLVERRLKDRDCDSGVILDGYPRTINQAGVLLKMLGPHALRPAVVHLVVDYDRIVARLSGRRQCPVCGTLYSLKTNPPKIAGICDLDGAKLVTREDDRESVIRERLREYDLQTVPILNYFREAGVPMLEIGGAGATPEQIVERICEALAGSGLVQVGLGSNSPAVLGPVSETSAK